ncbi:MAG: hypothetical protein ACR2NN_20190 [Bryobacteraceae bacterium]
MHRALLLASVTCLFAASFRPADVAIVGDIEYGQTSDPVDCSDTPRYRALVFNGNSGDRVEVTVKGRDRKAFVAFADGTLRELASGTTHLGFTLPNAGPDAEAYYIVFRDNEDKPAQFTVELKKVKKELVAEAQ